MARAFGSYPEGRWFKSCCRYHEHGGGQLSPQIYGPLVKRLRLRPFTPATRVRISYGSPTIKESPDVHLNYQGFFFFVNNILVRVKVRCYNVSDQCRLAIRSKGKLLTFMTDTSLIYINENHDDEICVVDTHDIGILCDYSYVVIFAQYNDKWFYIPQKASAHTAARIATLIVTYRH